MKQDMGDKDDRIAQLELLLKDLQNSSNDKLDDENLHMMILLQFQVLLLNTKNANMLL